MTDSTRWMLLASLVLSTIVATKLAAGAEARVSVQRDVIYIDDGDHRHGADIYIPPGDGPFPAVLMIHGGAWTTGSKGHMLGHARTVSDAGYVVMSINYRLAPKYKFPAQIDDCKSAVRWMRTNADKYKIDPQRIAAYGYSAGGQLACLLGTTDADDGMERRDIAEGADDTRVQCVIAGGAPCEFRTMPQNVDILSYWLGGSRGEMPEQYRLASPTSFVTADDPPVFFFHGETDSLVPRVSPKSLQAALLEHGIKTEFHVIAGKGHIGAFLDGDAPLEAVRFLDGVLKKNEVSE